MSGIGSFIASFFPTTHADAEEEKPADTPETEQAEAEAEPEEPEDAHPAIRAECESRPDCAPLKHHFEKCQEKVQAGEGFKGEECVEEMFHMMHCSEACAAPKVFAKLR
ncbi:Non-heme 11 kDa protein of cytochrome bc1 complex [Roridomyces roridus]|uniref:Non-heme 11 kDa protein of cytochrome bc1 complex n=1 Tax=Roridomyces roridus TaxID=1738132 RepID=A0AAD7CD54_9AGAR|nr:Non-heme 11 kDa protein of cytochrome bc1 complex [Roridomyces roridus]KAJ7644976.1 Non-heme 11 kDa protein of cytochrome bc1 complex [Roridomyces roridus]